MNVESCHLGMTEYMNNDDMHQKVAQMTHKKKKKEFSFEQLVDLFTL